MQKTLVLFCTRNAPPERGFQRGQWTAITHTNSEYNKKNGAGLRKGNTCTVATKTLSAQGRVTELDPDGPSVLRKIPTPTQQILFIL